MYSISRTKTNRAADTDTFRVLKSKNVAVSLSSSSSSSLPSTLSRSSSFCCSDIESSAEETILPQSEEETNVLPAARTSIPNIYDCMICATTSTFTTSANAAPNRCTVSTVTKDNKFNVCPLIPKTPLPLTTLTLSAFRKPRKAVRLTSSLPNKLLLHDYDMSSSSRILGHGTSSTVRLASHRHSGVKVAVKCIAKHDILRRRSFNGTQKMCLEEYEILSSLKNSHENIINLLDVYETEDEVQLVMEYCAGGELFDAIQNKWPAGRLNPAKSPKRKVQSEIELCISNNVYLGVRQKRSRQEAHISDASDFTTLDIGKRDNKKNKQSSSLRQNPDCYGNGYIEMQAASITYQLLSALAYLHEKGIVHRDVKPENIFLSKEENGSDKDRLLVKLSDFGLARFLYAQNVGSKEDESSVTLTTEASPLTPPSISRSRAYSSVGSDHYAAPEVRSGKGYGTAADMYSLGVTLFVLLSGFPPSPRPKCELSHLNEKVSYLIEEDLIFSNISHGDFPYYHWCHVSASAKDLVRRMLHPNPSIRITASQALEHKWTTTFQKFQMRKKINESISSSQKNLPMFDFCYMYATVGKCKFN